MNKGFFDIHHHILCGVDDGAKDEQMMFEMLSMAAEDGITDLVATPHAEPGIHPFSQRQRHMALAAARDYCQREGIALRLHEGAEILYTDHACRLLQEGYIPTLAGTDRVLVEFLPNVPFRVLVGALEKLLSSGFLPVVAHTERYACLTRWPSRAAAIKKDLPVFYQVNCSTLLHGSIWPKRFAFRLLEQGLLDAVATDAHNTANRAVCMSRAYSLLCDGWGTACADELTHGILLGLHA